MTTPDLIRWLLSDDGPIATDETDAQQWARDIERHQRETAGRATPCGCQACIALTLITDTDLDADPPETLIVHPDRVLSECAAKRRIIELHLLEPVTGQCSTCVEAGRYPCETLLALAQVYRGRPGWRPEWETG